MVSSWDPLPPSCHSSGTRRTCVVVSGFTAPFLPLLRNQQFLWCHLETTCPMPAAAQKPAGPVVLSWGPLPAAAPGPVEPVLSSQDPLSTDCLCSGTCRTYCVVSGPTATCLPVIRDQQNMWCHLKTTCPLPAAAQGPIGPLVSSWGPLPPSCHLFRDLQDLSVISVPTVTCMLLLRNAGPLLSSQDT